MIPSIAKHIEFVKEQAAFHDERASMFSKNKFRHNKHLQTAQKFHELADFIEKTKPTATKIGLEITALSPDDLDGLPDELLAELSISKADKSEFLVADLVRNHQGIMSLDQILIEYFKATNEVMKRTTMTNRLYRMVQKGLLYSVPGKKGIYSTEPTIEEPEDQNQQLMLDDPDLMSYSSAANALRRFSPPANDTSRKPKAPVPKKETD